MHVVMYTKCPGLSGELQTAMDKKTSCGLQKQQLARTLEDNFW